MQQPMRLSLALKVLFVLAGISPVFSISAQIISDGYADAVSYFPGDTANVYINAISTVNHAKIYLRNAEGTAVDSMFINAVPQSAQNAQPWQNGFGYQSTFGYVIPSLPSGFYNFENKIFLIIKSREVHAITIVYPTNTIMAYDSSGGKSLYDFNSPGGRSGIVSLHRPWDYADIHNGVVECNGILKWLLTQPDIDYKLISDMDMDDAGSFAGSQIIMIIGHSEYWTRAGRRNFDQFVNNGGHALVYSGNTMWWQVRYSVDKSQLICYKDSTRDVGVPDSLLTVNWPDPKLGYPTTQSIGCDWPHGAYGMKNPHGWYGYKIMSPASPLLAGTGLHFGDTLSCKSYELDCTPYLGIDYRGYLVVDNSNLGVCNIELVGFDYGQRTTSQFATYGYGSFIAYQKSVTTGSVINTAFNYFTSESSNDSTNGAIAHAGGFGGPDSLKIQRVVRNCIDLLLTGKNIFSSPRYGGTISGPDSAVAGFPCVYIDSGASSRSNLQWQISDVSANGPFISIGNNGDTLHYTFTDGGDYWIRAYDVNAAGCAGGSMNVFYTYIKVTGSSVCDAIALHTGVNGPFNTDQGSIQSGEPVPVDTGCGIQTGWCNNALSNTLWFSFRAPVTGRVRINTVGSDTKIAVWSAARCDTLLNGGGLLLAANDDDDNFLAHHIHQHASWIDSIGCLVPGAKYYVQVMSADSVGDTTSIELETLNTGPDASFQMKPTVCLSTDSIPLRPATAGGIFTGPGVIGNYFYPPEAGVGGPYIINHIFYSCYQSADSVIVEREPDVQSAITPATYSGRGDIQLEVNGGLPPYSYAWSNGDTLQFANNLMAGIYDVTVSDAAGCQTIVTDTISLINGLGVRDFEKSIVIYPNPATDFLVIKILTNGSTQWCISLTSATGRIIADMHTDYNASERIILSTSKLPAGIYFLQVNGDHYCITKKVIIAR